MKELIEAGISSQLVELINSAPVIKTEIDASQEYLSRFSGFTIVDAETYRAAKAFATEIRTKRLDLDKRLTGASSALKTIVKGYEAESGKLLTAYKKTETEIRTEIQRVDDEKKAEKEREQREAAAKFMQRTEELFEVGFAFDGYAYKCGMIILTPDKISDLSDEELSEYVRKGQIESERIANILKAAEPAPAPSSNPVAPTSNPVENASDWFAIPVLPPTVPDNFFDQPKQVAQPQANFKPAGYSAGFDACKKEVLDILARPDKFTRSELIELIKNLSA